MDHMEEGRKCRKGGCGEGGFFRNTQTVTYVYMYVHRYTHIYIYIYEYTHHVFSRFWLEVLLESLL